MNETNARPEDPNQLRELVSESYGKIAERASRKPGGAGPGADEAARRIGYEAEQLDAIPEGARRPRAGRRSLAPTVADVGAHRETARICSRVRA